MKKGLPRWIDATAAGVCLVVCSPLLLAASIGVIAGSGFPVLFRQKRIGQSGRTFTLFKFRTMRTGNAGPQVTASGDCRITPPGRVLRKTKIDELPSLWNVLRGDMSLVGPRPEVPVYVDYNDERWREVLQARPGLTDPVTLRLRNEEELMASIEGDPEMFYRNDLQAFKLAGYVMYLKSRTATRDLMVIAATIAAIVHPSRTPAPSPAEIRLAARATEAAQ